MTWIQTEFLLKGIYLGLLCTVALRRPTWQDLGWVALCSVGGVVLCLAVAAFQKMREGYRIHGRLLGFLLFLLLENPGSVYLGVVIGLLGGDRVVARLHEIAEAEMAETLGQPIPPENWWLLAPVVGGALLGILFYFLRHVRDRQKRKWLGLGLAVALLGGGYAALYFQAVPADDQFKLGILLLMGLPGFYLLTFSSMVEESEIEIAAICAALGIGLFIIGQVYYPNLSFGALAFPLAFYYVYTRQVLPGLRVFKHTLRGLSYSQIGEYRQALASLGRALQLDPRYPLAREQLWELHRKLDVATLQKQPEILGLIDYNLCLERIAELLLRDKPQPAHLDEALRLLELTAKQRPDFEPCCQYWRAVAYSHQKHFDLAAGNLESLLQAADTPARRTVAFAAWQLALFLHPEMRRRVGQTMLTHPDRKLDAIAAAERTLAGQADHGGAWEMKRLLYSELTEADFDAARGLASGRDGGGAKPQAALVDYGYCQQLGLALIDDAHRWLRGCEYLRIAAHGLSVQGPTIFIQIAKVHEKHSDPEAMWDNYHRALVAGRAVGVANLPAEERKQLASVVKTLAERAMKSNQLDAALEAYKFYSQFDQGQLETYRTLAELFERKSKLLESQGERGGWQQNIWLAMHCVEHARSYNADDPDLHARKDRYYYTLTPDELRGRVAQAPWFDVDYCLEKTKWAIERFNGDLEVLDWAKHLAALARVAKPKDLMPRLLEARIHRLRGEIPETTALLEEIRQNKPPKFASEDEEDAWFVAHRLLGDLYLDDKADQAVACFQEFRKSPRSGADTAYKLARAFENLGDFKRAVNFYDEVTTFPDHPLYYEARDGLERVRQGGVRAPMSP